MSKGSISKRLQVHHLCNNRTCCNPYHLELGDNSENQRYSVICGTHGPRGESHGNSKLITDQVREIHKLYREGLSKSTLKGCKSNSTWQITESIAQKFGISKSTVIKIINGKNWKDIYKEFHKEDK